MKNILILSILALYVGCSAGKNSTGYNFISDMMFSEAYESFSENHHFENGQTMQLPPEGTVARGFMPHHYTQGDGEKAGVELLNPHEVNEKFIARGKHLFNNMCAVCHGDQGLGDGPVIEKGVPAPPSYRSRRIKKYSVGQIYNVITVGYGNMASHAQQLFPEDRWAVAEYVKQELIK